MRCCLSALSPEQKRQVIFDARAYDEIVTGNAATVQSLPPVGLAAAQMTPAQRAQLEKLIEVYARTFEPALADARMARVRDGGIDSVRFGWAGSIVPGGQYSTTTGSKARCS